MLPERSKPLHHAYFALSFPNKGIRFYITPAIVGEIPLEVSFLGVRPIVGSELEDQRVLPGLWTRCAAGAGRVVPA